ncbi:MAG: cell division protein ZapB [Rhodocyclaceae bacterium]|nr:cell division protein ZapB [Rhodocyclaceae bacterium]
MASNCLTEQSISHKLHAMDELLAGLEDKIARLIAQCNALRVENRQLRERLIALEEEKERLAQRMSAARQRLEALAQRLPNP